MSELHDSSEANWFEEKIKKMPENIRKEPLRVWHIIPQGFFAYCKILPPVYLDLDLKEDLRTWNDLRNSSEEEQFLLSYRTVYPEVNFKAKRITWKELADFQKIKFTPQIFSYDLFNYSWPIQFVNTAGEGEISPETANLLSKILLEHTQNKDYFVSYIDYKDISNIHNRIFKYNLSSGLTRISTRLILPGTQVYYWGENRDWCIAIDFDSDFFFLGGNEHIVSSIIENSDIDSIKVEIDTKI